MSDVDSNSQKDDQNDLPADELASDGDEVVAGLDDSETPSAS